MSGPSVVIVGAGLIGLCSADALQRRGCEVTVLDARPGPVRGTSFSNSGMLHPSQFRPWVSGISGATGKADGAAGQAVRDLARDSLPLLRERMRALDLRDALDRPHGCYQLFDTVEAAQAAQGVFAGDGIRANVVVHPERTFGRPALYFPDDRSADARAFGEALAADLAARGVTFIYEAAGVRLRAQDGGVGVALEDADGGHRFRAEHVVVAAGVQSAELLEPLGLSLRVEAVRGWAVDFALPEGTELPPVPVMDSQSRSALTVFPDRFRLSGTLGEESAKPLLARWAEIIPESLAGAGKPLSVWSGLRPVSRAGRPFIGESPVPGLWVNCGHGHLGWTLCMGSGEVLARALVDGEPDVRFAYAG